MSVGDTSDFIGYEPTTTDPGWSFTIGIIVISIFLNLLIPVLVRTVRVKESSNEKGTPEDGNTTKEETQQGFKSQALSVVKGGSPSVTSNKHLTASQISTAQNLYPAYNRNGLFTTGANSIVSDVFSVQSKASSTVFSQAASAVLGVRPTRNGNTGRVGKRRRNVNSKYRKRKGGKNHYQLDQDQEFLDSVSVGDRSVLSVLDQDAVSVKDAVDANEVVLLEKTQRPTNLWTQFLEIADWDPESKRLLELTIPYTIQGVSESVSEIVTVAIIGHFMGVMEANVYIVVSLLTEFTGTITYGFEEANGVLIPQAQGTGNTQMVGRYLQLSIIMYTVFAIPSIVIWALYTENAVLWLGFDQETAALAQRFVYPWLGMYTFEGLESCLYGFLDTTGHEKFSTGIQLLYEFLDTGLVAFMILVVGTKDLVFIAIMQAFLGLLMTLACLAYTVYRGWLEEYWGGLFESFSLKDRRAVSTMMATAIPYSISWVLTYGEWEVLTLFASVLGPAEVAAWGLLGYVWDAFEEVTSGLASAAEVRVGYHMGAGQPHSGKIVAYKTVYMGTIISIFSASIMFILGGNIPHWLTPDPTLQRMIFDLLPLVGFGQILLILGTVLWGVVGAQGRVRLATAVEFLASWFVVIPLSAVTVYVLEYGLIGLVGALVLSYCCGGVIMSFIVLQSDWNKHSQIVISRNADEGQDWEENEWDELPPHIQCAASVLGYTKQIWNNDEDPPAALCDWKKLTASQKTAARTMGYNRLKWDSEGETGASSGKSTFDDCDWEELPKDAKEAALVLGYTSRMWDADESPESSDCTWNELTPKQQEAARILGYDQAKWDTDSDSSDEEDASQHSETKKHTPDARTSPHTSLPQEITNVTPKPVKEKEPEEALDGKYEDFDFDELPRQAKQAAVVLGYTETSWDESENNPVEDKYWRQLTEAEKVAARTLGYDEKGWDGGEGKEYDRLEWEDLPLDVQAAAALLGYDKKLWDSDGCPACEDKYWHQLSTAQRDAATKIGFTEEKWNQESS